MEKHVKNNLGIFVAGFGTASVFIGMMLLIDQWEETTLLVKAIYIVIVMGVLLLDWKLTFGKHVESDHTKESTDKSSK